MKELLKEIDDFNKNLDAIIPNAIERIKSNIIEMHSLREDYTYNDDCFSGINKVLTKVIVKGLEVGTLIHTYSFYSFIKNETIHNFSYSLTNNVKTDHGGVIDGKVTWLIWEAIKDDIDLSLYPNFNFPEFSDGKERSNKGSFII